MTEEEIIEAVVEAQADLQVGIGCLRLEVAHISKESIIGINLRTSEDKLNRSLARLHKLLDQLGQPMYQPAAHPDINV
jgi:hypothetical protein